MQEDREEMRGAVAAIMVRLYTRGLTTTSGGNVSLRLADGGMLITAAGTDKGTMSAADIVVMGPDGTNHTPHLRPSTEHGMHAAILRRHPRVGAIVHAHPPAATSFAVTGRPLDCRVMAEAYALIGEPVVAPYALTGTPELAESVAAALGPHTACVLMEHHGVLAVGRTLLEAFDRLEVLENTARILCYAGAEANPVPTLSADRLRALDALMGRA